MRREVGRRAFVGGTVAASAGLIALRGFGADALMAQAHNHARQRTDPMLQLFIQESIAIRREIKASRLRGEHARRHAAALRMATAYGRHAGLDDLVRGQLRQVVRERGREAVLQTRFDYDHAVAELRAQGVVAPEELPDPNLLTRDQRRAALEELLRHGVTPLLARQSGMVDRGASALDRYGSTAPPAVILTAFQQDPAELCRAGWEAQMILLRASSIFVCAMPPLWELCMVIQLDILLLEVMQWYFCG